MRRCSMSLTADFAPRARFAPIAMILLTALVALIAAGCRPDQKGDRPRMFTGPTDPIEKVIAAINANNARIPTLWAHHKFEANIVDPESKKEQFVNGYGAILYNGPQSLRLTAKKEVTDLFDLGANDERFWMRVVPDKDTFWWGRLANVDKPCMRGIPIRPDQIVQVMGASVIDVDLTREPLPVMRFNNDADAYMLVWQYHSGDRWLAQKEIWYDRATLHPETVLLFDQRGRVVLRAWLSKYDGVDDGGPREKRPQIATSYRLFFPDTGTKMSFDLSDMSLSHNGFPKAVSFRMPDPRTLSDAGVKVIQIDEDCGP